MEWASFLKSVRSTLVSFTFEQGLEPDESLCFGWRSVTPPQHGRPMDVRFMAYVFPAIVDGPWPQLKTLSIRGVGGDYRGNIQRETIKWERSAIDALVDQIRMALGSQVQLTFDEKATQSFALCMDGFLYRRR